MNTEVQARMNVVEMLAKGDDVYYGMLKECRELEKKYDAVLRTLPEEQRDIVCDFVSQCEGMSWRMLEIACTHMRFPKE